MRTLVAIAIVSFFGLNIELCSAQIYWAHQEEAGKPLGPGSIQLSSLDGASSQVVIGGLNHPTDIVIDQQGGVIYWTESIGDKIRRANLDGSGAQTLVNINDPERLLISFAAGKMYWSGDNLNLFGADLNGANVEVLSDPGPPAGEILAIAKGSEADSIYYVESNVVFIPEENFTGYRGTLSRFDAGDFSTSQTMYELDGRAIAMAIDEVNSKLYWSDDSATIWRANLSDGSDPVIVSTTQASRDMFIDYDRDRLWWTWEATIVGQPPAGISSIPLGGGPIVSFSVPFRPNGIWVVPEPTSSLLYLLGICVAVTLRQPQRDRPSQ